jgi:L-Ala-D/L-Glu epimerase
MQIQFFPFRLEFIHPFVLAHSQRTGTNNCYILLTKNDYVGWGETVFIPYYPEDKQSFDAFFKSLQLPHSLDEINPYIQNLLEKYSGNFFSIAGLDIALHNLRASIHNQSIASLYQLETCQKETSFTLGISCKASMELKINENPNAYYKLKVSEHEIQRIVSDFQSITNKPFTIDANQGFTSRKIALEWSYKLCDLGVEYLEQPFHKEDLESHAWLKSRSPIPIMADESFQSYPDLEKIYTCFDGINLKLMKCGGVSEGVRCLKRAQEMELKSIIGCMSESSIVSRAAYQIAGLADWIDLDGPLLLKNDPFKDEMKLEERIKVLNHFK